MRSPASFRLAIVAAGIILLGACGSSVPDDTTASLRATTTAAATTTDATGSSTTTASSTSAAPTSEPGGGASGGAFCEQMSRIASFADDEFEELEFGDDADLTPADFEAMKKAFLDITETMQKATAAAPSEIRSDMEYMASFFEKLNEGIAAAQSPEELFGAMFALGMEAEDDGADEDRLDEAEDRIEDFVERHCGFEMEMDD